MKPLKFYINEKEHFKGGKADDMSLEDIAKDHGVDIEDLKKEFDMGVEVEMEHTDNKSQAEEIAKDHLVEFPDYYSRLKDMEADAEDEDNNDIEITVDLDIPDEDDIEDDLDESELNERKIRQTKKMKNSAKVVRETTEELFGKDGKARPLADKVFKVFKRELRIKAKELGVSLGQVRQWKITLRDYDSPKEGTTIAGKRNK
jgi:hypothetical protein